MSKHLGDKSALHDDAITSSGPIIACASDEKYAPHLTTMLYSLASNISIKPYIYIIDNNISEKSKDKLISSLDAFNVQIEYLTPIIDDTTSSLVISKHISTTAYLRLQIPELLRNTDKVIYLDSDLIVNNDVVELWNVSVDDHALAAVENPNFTRCTELGIEKSDGYFNSGLMIINTAYWTKHNVRKSVEDFILNNQACIKLWDQDGLNAVLKNAWKVLPAKWNVQRSFYEKGIRSTFYSPDEIQDSIANPSVIHYTSSSKPWHIFNTHPAKKVYTHYRNQTNFRWYIPDDLRPRSILYHLVIKHIRRLQQWVNTLG